MNKKGRRKKYLTSLIFIILIIIFLYSAYHLINIFIGYKEGDDAYDDINIVFQSPDTHDENNIIENPKGEEKQPREEWTWNFPKMLEINKDTKGWIKQGNKLSYPVLQTKDNNYYLTHLPNGKGNKAGSLFIDYRISQGLEDRHSIIYGHNMKNKSMFGSLIGYYKESYYKNNKTFDIYIKEKHYIYEVFAAYETPEVSDTYSYGFANDEVFNEYLIKSRKKSIYNTEFRELTSVDKIITLSTCTEDDDTKRFVVQIVRKEEVLD